MKKLLIIIATLCVATTAYCQQPLVCIGESDGDPYVWNVCVPGIIADGATVTDNGDGTVTLGLSAGSGDITDVFDCASGNCQSITMTAGDVLDTTNGTLELPQQAACNETTEGRICWDTDDDTLCVGSGSACTVIGSGDITSVGDCATGAAFGGACGSILTFFHSGGNSTMSWDGVDLALEHADFPSVQFGTLFINDSLGDQIGTALPGVSVHGNNNDTPGINFVASSNATSSLFDFRRSRGSNEAPSVISNNDILSEWRFYGRGSSTWVQSSEIQVIIDEGTPSDSAMGSEILFIATPTGSTTPATIVEIDGDGLVTVTGSLQTTGNAIINGAITEAGQPVYNGSEVPGGELGGTFASFTIDDGIAVTSWTLTTTNLAGITTVSGTLY